MKLQTKYIFITISINLIIACLIFLYLINFDFVEFFRFLIGLSLNFIIGILGLYLAGYLIGEYLYKLKTKNKRFNVLDGVFAIFSVLLFGTIIGSTVGFIQEGLPDEFEYKLSQELFDYYVKPLYWIFLFGFLPTLISGLILGYKLKNCP